MRVVSMAAKRTATTLSTRAKRTKTTSAAAVEEKKPLRRSARLQKEKPLSTAEDINDQVPAKKSRKKAAPRAKKSVDSSTSFRHGTLSRAYESKQIARGFKHVVGVDEAGRGPLAGPVVAAACYVPLDVTIVGIHDSKKLNEEQRKTLYEQLVSHPQVQYAVHINSAQRIDEINILQAALESMVKAVEALPEKADFVYVDGNRMPSGLTVPAETVVQGDSKVYSIAAASVIAKVTRDRLMLEYDEKFPMYGLKQHKGYPTRDHMAAIAEHGPCEIHRMTFAPLKQKEPKVTKEPKRKRTTTK